jgi:sugar O-acyltransferase (sialic acid O-acetyltransferase NeuD family)
MSQLPSGTPIVVWGASGHALVVADILRSRGFSIVGYLDDVHPQRAGEPFGGATVLGGGEVLQHLAGEGVRHGIVAIGNNPARMALSDLLEKNGLLLVSALHPTATICADAVLGPGCVAAAGSVIGVGTRLGRAVVVNTCASVDHESIVGDGAHLSPGSRLAGRVTIGRLAWIGAGAVVVDGVSVGDDTTVGAGAVVLADLPPRVVAAGVPARILRHADVHPHEGSA